MAVSFANIFMVKIETTLTQESETKVKNQRPVTHLLSQNSPLSKMVDCYKNEAWALSTRFLRRKLISTEEALFYGGSWFLRRRLIYTEEADFHWGGQFVSNRLIFVWKTRTIAQRKQGFNPERVCFTVCSSGTIGPPYYSPIYQQAAKRFILFYNPPNNFSRRTHVDRSCIFCGFFRVCLCGSKLSTSFLISPSLPSAKSVLSFSLTD